MDSVFLHTCDGCGMVETLPTRTAKHEHILYNPVLEIVDHNTVKTVETIGEEQMICPTCGGDRMDLLGCDCSQGIY